MRAPRLVRKSLAEQIADQRKWIDERGGNLAGYVARYGSRNDAEHYGDGGEAIYAADTEALRRLEAQQRRR